MATILAMDRGAKVELMRIIRSLVPRLETAIGGKLPSLDVLMQQQV